MVNGADYWPNQHSQLTPLTSINHPPKVQVIPAHPPPSDPLTTTEEDKDKFKCLYLLVETAVAVRQREKEQEDIQV